MKLVRRTLGLAKDVEVHFWGWLEDLDQSLADERATLIQATQWIQKDFQVTSRETMALGAQLADKARDRLRALEDERKQFTSPLLAAKALVDATYKPSTKALIDAIDAAKSKIATFSREEEDRRRAQMTVSAIQYQAGGTPTAMIPEPPVVQGVSTRVVWKVRVLDPDMVPRQYCSPDQQKLQSAIWYADTDNPPQPILGCEFYRDDIVTIRGGAGK